MISDQGTGYDSRMCSNYRPPKSEVLAKFETSPPSFDFGECYPGSIGPFLASVKPDTWLPGTSYPMRMGTFSL